jgi:hypothetical protein
MSGSTSDVPKCFAVQASSLVRRAVAYAGSGRPASVNSSSQRAA